MTAILQPPNIDAAAMADRNRCSAACQETMSVQGWERKFTNGRFAPLTAWEVNIPPGR